MHFTETAFDPYVLSLPATDPIPLVADSPHSGATYPADFGSCLPISVLRSAEDCFIDELWGAIPTVGGSLLAAAFPRTYIDLNREATDIDVDLLAEPWPHELAPTEKSTLLGHGLIWRTVRGQAVYDRKLWVAEVEGRIDSYFQPYIDALDKQVEAAVMRFGCVWHLNLHSMPSSGKDDAAGTRPLADFVLGDLDGTSCDPTLLGIIEDYLREAGHTVARNDPYKGASLIQRFGRPDEHRNSLQIEVKRSLYMDEATYEKSPGFEELKHTLDGLSTHIAAFIRSLI